MPGTPIPPSARRCLLILQAHHLHCQALSQRPIAERMGHGINSTDNVSGTLPPPD